MSRGVSGGPSHETRIGSGAVVALAAQALSLIASVVVGALIARALGPSGKGALSVVQQTVAIALAFANLGLSTSNIYFVSKGELVPGVAVGNSLALAGVVTLVSAVPVTLLLFGPVAVLPEMPWYVAAIAVAAVAVGLVLAWMVSVAVGIRGLRPQATTSVAVTSTSLGVVLALVAFGRLSVSGVLLSGVVGSIVGLVAVLFWTRGRVGTIRVDVVALRTTARHSIRVHLASLADFLHLRQDVLLLGWLAGSAAVGHYSVGVSFAELAWYVPVAVGQAIQAQASRVAHDSAVEIAARGTRVTTLITVVISGVLALIVPFVLPAVFGERFRDSIWVFYLLLPGAALNGITTLMSYFQVSRGLVYWRQSLAVVAVNVIANLVFAPMWGAFGAAAASSLSYAVFFVLILRLMLRDTGLRVGDLLVANGPDLRMLSRVVRGYLRRR